MEHEERKPDAKKHLLAIFGCDHTIDEFTSIYAISAYHPRQGALKTTLCGKTIASYLWQVGFFFLGTLVSSANKSDCDDVWH